MIPAVPVYKPVPPPPPGATSDLASSYSLLNYYEQHIEADQKQIADWKIQEAAARQGLHTGYALMGVGGACGVGTVATMMSGSVAHPGLTLALMAVGGFTLWKGYETWWIQSDKVGSLQFRQKSRTDSVGFDIRMHEAYAQQYLSLMNELQQAHDEDQRQRIGEAIKKMAENLQTSASAIDEDDSGVHIGGLNIPGA